MTCLSLYVPLFIRKKGALLCVPQRLCASIIIPRSCIFARRAAEKRRGTEASDAVSQRASHEFGRRGTLLCVPLRLCASSISLRGSLFFAQSRRETQRGQKYLMLLCKGQRMRKSVRNAYIDILFCPYCKAVLPVQYCKR